MSTRNSRQLLRRASQNCFLSHRTLAVAAFCLLADASGAAQIIDYHQHLYSPEAGAKSTPGPNGISAQNLIGQMDAAGISRAVVLSVAYSFSNPNKPAWSRTSTHT